MLRLSLGDVICCPSSGTDHRDQYAVYLGEGNQAHTGAYNDSCDSYFFRDIETGCVVHFIKEKLEKNIRDGDWKICQLFDNYRGRTPHPFASEEKGCLI